MSFPIIIIVLLLLRRRRRQRRRRLHYDVFEIVTAVVHHVIITRFKYLQIDIFHIDLIASIGIV